MAIPTTGISKRPIFRGTMRLRLWAMAFCLRPWFRSLYGMTVLDTKCTDVIGEEFGQETQTGQHCLLQPALNNLR